MAPIARGAAICCDCASRIRPSTPLRPLTSSLTALRPRRTQPRRCQSTEAASDNATGSTNPKVAGLVDQIGQLTLLETADLVKTLKSRLNIPDIPMGGFGGGGAAAAPAAAPVEEDEPAPKQEEKTLFNLKLKSIDATAKPKIIKEIKSMLGLSLVDSKKFVESAPKMMKESVPKEEGEKIQKTMKDLGAEVEME
ncbi:MAG: hypothetical protein M1831_003941 [Alyxoria varia]|nr:MAG: hypothetical protein M1831_003941 [Alyxoria varia]